MGALGGVELFCFGLFQSINIVSLPHISFIMSVYMGYLC